MPVIDGVYAPRQVDGDASAKSPPTSGTPATAAAPATRDAIASSPGSATALSDLAKSFGFQNAQALVDAPAGHLPPNATLTQNGYSFSTDASGRLKSASGQLYLQPGVRDPAAQMQVGWGDRLSTDHGGHLIGTRFNGPGDYQNLAAQNGNLNTSAYKRMENMWAQHVRAGDDVRVNVEAVYDHGGLRPSHFVANYEINGEPFTQVFPNSAGAGSTSVIGDVGKSEAAMARMGTVAKGLDAVGKVAVPVAVAADGVQLYNAYKQDGNTIGAHTAETAGSVAGGWAGAAIGAESGAEVGGAIGAAFGGVGAVPGAIIGGLAGGVVGGIAGSSVGKGVVHFVESLF